MFVSSSFSRGSQRVVVLLSSVVAVRGLLAGTATTTTTTARIVGQSARGLRRAPFSAQRRQCALRVLSSESSHAEVSHVVTDAPTFSSESASSRRAAVDAACASLLDALADKRRVDELVCRFAYSGLMTLGPKHEYPGQGAVKRGLSTLLFEHDAVEPVSGSVSVVAETKGSDDDVRLLSLDVDGESREFELRFEVGEADQYLDAASVVQLDASPANEAASRWLEARSSRRVLVEDRGESRSSGASQPKWETDDGRVRQRIWQSSGLFEPGNRFLLEKMEITTGRLVLIVDATVWDLYETKFETWADSVDVTLDPIIAPGNEDEKTMGNLMYLLDELARVDPLRRSEPCLAVGGGVLTDTAGFACALWRRGVPWCRLPTTLLGMVDASVGIKVAVNYHRKNGVGHFFSPLHTFIDSTFLETLDKADVRSGCGEIMKAALIHDATLFDLMETHGSRLVDMNFHAQDQVANEIVKRSVDAMLECIAPDLWEESLLRPMDFGHSFSRTLEASEQFQLRHGEAVAIDCVMSTMLANVKGLVSDADAQRVLDVYADLKLPCSIKGITADTYKVATREITVHRDGILRAPLPHGIGRCAFVDDFSDADIDAAFAKLETFMADHPDVLWDNSKSFNPGGVKAPSPTTQHIVASSPSPSSSSSSSSGETHAFIAHQQPQQQAPVSA